MTKLDVDCLNLIFNELQAEKKYLHSCLLVNKEWCHLVVPILWKKYPKCYDKGTEKKLFNTILSCLPSSSKQLLFDNDIKLFSTNFLKPLLFNYISFCKILETEIINEIIKMVLEEEFNTSKYDKRNDKKKLLEQEIYKLFVTQCKNIKELQWRTSQSLSLFQGASTCFSQLYSLSVDIDFVSSNALYAMSQICKDLNKLTISGSQDFPGLISLIDAQRNLKSISLCPPKPSKEGTCKNLGKALEKKCNTISSLYLGSVNIIPSSSLTSLINLKKIKIDTNNGEDIKDFQQCLAISKFQELQTLSVRGLSCFKELAMLIGRTKGNILKVSIDITNETVENTEMLIEAIANNCPKIERLSTYIKRKDFIYIKSLLLNCRNLVLLELNNLLDESDNIGDELLDILTKFSPKSLTKVAISGDWKYSIDAFKKFFESCRGRNLNSFDIYNEKSYITRDHKLIVGKYVNEKVIKQSNCL